MRWGAVAGLAVLVCHALPVWGAGETAPELSIAAEADPVELSVQDTCTLTITIRSGASLQHAPEFTLPEALRVVARRQAQNLSFRGGTVERTLTLTYVLQPTAPGTYELGPFAVEYNGRSYTASGISITVGRGKPPLGGKDAFQATI